MKGKWMIKSMITGSNRETIDGKPFDPSKMGG